jgi:hypothetical protein
LVRLVDSVPVTVPAQRLDIRDLLFDGEWVGGAKKAGSPTQGMCKSGGAHKIKNLVLAMTDCVCVLSKALRSLPLTSIHPSIPPSIHPSIHPSIPLTLNNTSVLPAHAMDAALRCYQIPCARLLVSSLLLEPGKNTPRRHLPLPDITPERRVLTKHRP